MMDAGERLVVLDSRPMDEFRVMSIPGGVCCPGAELVHRVGDAAPDPDTLVVVNCAGRTRSIIGAQSLINAGVPNRVTALRNGTMGWHLAGYELARGRDDRPPPRGAAWREGSARAAERLAARFGVEYVDAATLAAWRREADARSLFVFDVRSPEEYREGHLADAVHAAGGQLVQATDEYVGTLGARIALVDDDGVRATLTASWLRQMGWEAYVVRGALEAEDLVTGPSPVVAAGVSAPALVSPSRARRPRREPAAPSSSTSRTAAPSGAGTCPAPGTRCGRTSPSGSPPCRPARSPCSPLRTGCSPPSRPRTWRVTSGSSTAAPPPGRRPGATSCPGRRSGSRPTSTTSGSGPTTAAPASEDAMQAYLTWEIDLVAQLARDRTARFGPFRTGSCQA